MAAKSIDFGQRSIEVQSSMEKYDIQPEIGQTPETLEDDLLPQPFQGDGMSVKVYYDQFCIWKNEMGAVGCDDEWYVVDFIYGLKMDLMVRVLRHSGIRRVSDVFRKAEIEEILISWEENYGLNKSDDVFEVMPQPKSVHNDEIHKAENVDDDKSDDLVGQIEVDHENIVSPIAAFKVFDNCSQPAFIAASGSNSMLKQCISFPVIVVADFRLNDMVNLLVPKARDEVQNIKCLMNPFYVKNENALVLIENVVIYYIDPGGSGSYQSFCMVANKVENKLGVVEEQTSWMKMGCLRMGEHLDELQEGEDIGIEKSGDLVVQLEADHRKIASYRDVFDELPKPILTASTAYKLIDENLDVYGELNSQEESTYNHNFGDSATGALKILKNSTEPNFTRLNHFSGNFYSYPMIDEVDLYLHKVFHRMTDPSPISQLSFFLVSSFGMGESHNSYPIEVDNQSFDYKLDDKMWLNELRTLIFDPGGVLVRIDVLPIVATQSFLSYEYIDVVKGLINGSTLARFGKVTSIIEVDLGKSFRESNTQRVLNEMPKLTSVVPNEESYAYGSVTSIDCVSLVLDSVNGLRYVEVRGPFTPMPMNNKVPLSLNCAIMVYYCSREVLTFHLFDPGGGYMSLTANHDTLVDKCARNDESSMPNNMCVPIVEWGLNKACKPLMQLMVDYKFWTKKALNLADIDIIHMIFWLPSDSVLITRVITLPMQQDVRTIGNFFMVAVKIELPSSEAHNMVIMGNKLRKLDYVCVKSYVGETVNQFNKSWQKVQSSDSIQSTQPLFKTRQQLNDQLLTWTSVNFQDSFLVHLDIVIHFSTHAILILILHGRYFSKRTEFHLIGKASSVLRDMRGCGLTIMDLGLGMLGPTRFELGLPLKHLKHFELYLTLKGYDGVTIVKFHVFIWYPGGNVDSSYILEDKDVVERVGKDMVLMDTTLVIKGYDHEIKTSCLDTMKFFGLSILHIGLETLRVGKFQLSLIASDHFKQCSDSHSDDDVFFAILENLVWDPGQNNMLLYIPENTLRPKSFKLLFLWDPDSDILDVSCDLPNRFGDSAAASLVSSTLELEHFIWDPGSFISVFKREGFGVNFHFTTLRTMWFSWGRICHDIAPF